MSGEREKIEERETEEWMMDSVWVDKENLLNKRQTRLWESEVIHKQMQQPVTQMAGMRQMGVSPSCNCLHSRCDLILLGGMPLLQESPG